MLTFETRIHRLEWFAQVVLIRVTPMLLNLRIGLRRRQSGQEQGARESSVEAGQKCIKIKGAWKSSILLTFGNWCLPAPSTLKPEEREFVVDSRSVDAHDQQKGLEWCWNGYLDEIVQSYDGHNRHWRSADAWRGNTLMNGSMVKNHISLKTGFGYSANTENFVPIVVPGLSTSSSSSSHRSTSMTLSRQECGHPTSSSSSSTSPTTTVLSDSETREREDLSGDRFPSSACVKFTCWSNRTGRPVTEATPKSKTKWKRNHDRTGRPVPFRNTGVAARIQRKSRGMTEFLEHGDSHASSSHESSLEPNVYEKWGFG